jgi:hypothetical protein
MASALALGVLAAPARAADADPDAELDKAVPARFVMGVKFGGGGVLWDEPDGTTLSNLSDTGPFDLPIFDETRGGYSISAGFFLQGIFFDHLGLEVGFHFVEHKLLEEIDWTFTQAVTSGGQTTVTTFTAESKQELQWTALHLPILVQAVVPAGKTRISLGVGPEFAFHSWDKTVFKITQTDEPDGLLPGSRKAFRSLTATAEDSVYLTVNFGIHIDAGDFLIPIDIHWSYNFSQESGYRDRVVVDPNEIPTDANPDAHPTSISLRTRDTMYGGIRIGIAYQF